MPYDREHGVLVWGGTLPGGELWTNSMRMAETEQLLLANDAAGWNMPELLDHYAGVLQTHHANPAAQISSRAKLTFVKFNRVDTNGHYIDPNTFATSFAPVSGGGGQGNMPNQVALVVTFTTDISRGRGSKGRLFAPIPNVTIDQTTGVMTEANATELAAAYKTLVEALSDVPGIDTFNSPGAVVMSKLGTGVRTRRIVGVKVGRVLDTQRRRRGALPETPYGLATVDQGAA